MLSQIKKKQYYGIWALAFALLIRAAFTLFPKACEILYGQMIFPSLRWIFDYTIGLLPFPLFYLFFAFAIYSLFKGLMRMKNLRYRFWNRILSILNFWGWILATFYFIWGFNYQRPELHEKLGLVNFTLKEKGLQRMLNNSLEAFEMINYEELQFGLDVNEEWLDEIRILQHEFLGSTGTYCTGSAKVKRLYPEGVFRKIGISGMYLPWTGQGNVDASLSNFEYPFIAAHEMSHAHGVTNEGEASFAAYATCIKSKNEIVKYSAELYLLRNILFELKMRDEDLFYNAMERLPGKIKFDLQKIRENMQRFPDIFPEISDAVNDTFLKAQGIESGSSSYGELLELVYAWKNQ